MSQRPFFSIIVPAHNEGAYIEDTVMHLNALTYPRDQFEVIIVENGSTDDTKKRIDAAAQDPVRGISVSTRGVSAARNAGIAAARADSDWLVFLDADIWVPPVFLENLAAHIETLDVHTVVGTVGVQPRPETNAARAWFRFYNATHHWFCQPFSSIIVRRAALAEVRFDETLSWMEDIHFVNDMRTHGAFFFSEIPNVTESIRRYEADGWWRHFFWNLFVGVLPRKLQCHFSYDVVR